jgi:hypothetical protein
MYKVIYTAFKVNRETGRGLVFTTTNMRALARHTELGYENLVRIFTRGRREYWQSSSGWEVLRSVSHFLGERRGGNSNNLKAE